MAELHSENPEAQFWDKALDVCKVKYYIWKSSILLAGTCGSSPIKIHYFDYPKRFSTY